MKCHALAKCRRMLNLFATTEQIAPEIITREIISFFGEIPYAQRLAAEYILPICRRFRAGRARIFIAMPRHAITKLPILLDLMIFIIKGRYEAGLKRYTYATRIRSIDALRGATTNSSRWRLIGFHFMIDLNRLIIHNEFGLLKTPKHDICIALLLIKLKALGTETQACQFPHHYRTAITHDTQVIYGAFSFASISAMMLLYIAPLRWPRRSGQRALHTLYYFRNALFTSLLQPRGE